MVFGDEGRINGENVDRMSFAEVKIMNRIDRTFINMPEDEKALIGYMTMGFPDVDETLRYCHALLEGCDLLELGIPFSDPVMDGPVIQRASSAALKGGFRIRDAFRLAERLRQSTEKPLLIMSYYNPVFRSGHGEFARLSAEAGIDGVIIPDLPMEEMDSWKEAAEEAGLYSIYFLSPTTPEQRMEAVGKVAKGFIYCISLKGVTGSRLGLASDLWDFLEKTRKHCRVPRALGLGISHPEQCRLVAEHVEAVVVGSAFVGKVMESLEKGEDPCPALAQMAISLKRALKT